MRLPRAWLGRVPRTWLGRLPRRGVGAGRDGPGPPHAIAARWVPPQEGMARAGSRRVIHAWPHRPVPPSWVSQQAPGPVSCARLDRRGCRNRPRGQLCALGSTVAVSQQAPGPVARAWLDRCGCRNRPRGLLPGDFPIAESQRATGRILIEPFRSKSIMPGPCCVKSTGPFEIDPPGQRTPCRRSMIWPPLPFPDQSAPWISTRPGAR